MKRLKVNSRGFAVAAGTVGVVAIMMAGAPPANHGIHERPSSLEVWKSGDSDPNQKIMVSLERKKLWLISGRDTLFSAPIAIGSGAVFRFANRTYRFETPRGERRILAKEEDPSWVPPDWHYYEKAVAKGLEPVHLKDGDRHELSDGTFLEVRGKEVGRINRFGNWWPFTPGTEIIFDGNIYIPELGSPQRRIPNALGPIKLVLGDGYLIHGTHRYNQQSIGTAASHGCIRMRNEDVERLSRMVNVGTRVYIY